MIKLEEYKARRKSLMQKMGSFAIAIIPSAKLLLRNADTEFPYRQHSDFYYLTGFEEPGAVLVLLKTHQSEKFILFNREKNPSEEVWTGFRAGQAGAVESFNADESFPIASFEEKLLELLIGPEKIYYTVGSNRALDATISKSLSKLRGRIRSGIDSPLEILDVGKLTSEMRLFKSNDEISLMKKAAEISAAAHIKAMQVCKPGVFEYDLEAEIMYHCQKQGARFQAYTPIVGSGDNSCILHYNENNKKIADNSIVLIDAGCEYNYYASDITRTFPANGKFSAEQKAIYDLVLKAQLAAIELAKPNTPWVKMQEAIVEVITQGLLDLKILQGNLKELIDSKAYQDFYMHNSGHWLGLDVHDVGSYKIKDNWRKLEPSMALTIEPGIYISKTNKNVAEKWHGIGVRIEDDVVITDNGCDILSAKAPKTINEIEELMNNK